MAYFAQQWSPSPAAQSVPNSPSTSSNAVFVGDLASVIARVITADAVALKHSIGVTEIERLVVELANAAMYRRMLNSAGELAARSPSPGIEVLVTMTERLRPGPRVLDVRLSVTNTLPDTLAFVGVSCVSFTNSALTLLQLDRDFALPAGSSTLLCPGSVAEYHATYTLRAEDLDDERELICSVLVEGRTESGEWVIAHEDDLIRLARSGLESAS